MKLLIDKLWNGAPTTQVAALHVVVVHDRLTVKIDAPFLDDPPPRAPPGHTDGLWGFEVVELFLLGERENYLELEFGPHGHHLGLQLAGVRQRVAEIEGIELSTTITRSRWQGTASLPAAHIPRGLAACNAYRIAGTGPNRRFYAHAAVPGEQPDFHRLEHFATCSLLELRKP